MGRDRQRALITAESADQFRTAMAGYAWTEWIEGRASYARGSGNAPRTLFYDNAALDGATFSVLVVARTSTADRSVCGRFSEGTTAEKCWLIDLAGGSGAARAIATNTGGGNAVVTAGTGTADGAWHTYVMTFDGSQTVRLYVDGVSTGTPATLSGTPNNTTNDAHVYVSVRSSADSALFVGDIYTFAYAAGVVLGAGDVESLHRARLATLT